MIKRFTHDMNSVDIRELARKHALIPGTRGTVTWSTSGRQTSQIAFESADHNVLLKYSHCASGGIDWVHVSECIPIVETALYGGGVRIWFACPNCNRRAAILYLSRQVACRRCHRLVYESQFESATTRAMRKMYGL